MQMAGATWSFSHLLTESGDILRVSTISGTTILIIALAGVGVLIWRRSQGERQAGLLADAASSFLRLLFTGSAT